MLAEQRGALALRVETGLVVVFGKGLQRARASGKRILEVQAVIQTRALLLLLLLL